MTKKEFLSGLRKKLSGLPQEDSEERLNFYSEIIDDRVEEGLSEEERREQMYLDNWHVNSKGHKVYAEQIIGKIDELL